VNAHPGNVYQDVSLVNRIRRPFLDGDENCDCGTGRFLVLLFWMRSHDGVSSAQNRSNPPRLV
jgi:hypothetical protein